MLDDSSIYKSKSRHEISYLVYARQKTYKNSTEIYISNKPYEKLEPGYELTKNNTRSSGIGTITSEEDKIERSVAAMLVIIPWSCD